MSALDVGGLTEYEWDRIRACIEEHRDCSKLGIPRTACNYKISETLQDARTNPERAQLLVTILLVMQALES